MKKVLLFFAVLLSLNSSSCFANCIATGGIESVDELNIFPNPTNGDVNIAFNNGYSIVKVEVYDLLGQIVIQNDYDHSKLITLKLDEASGVYIVSVTTSLGDSIDVKVTKF